MGEVVIFSPLLLNNILVQKFAFFALQNFFLWDNSVVYSRGLLLFGFQTLFLDQIHCFVVFYLLYSCIVLHSHLMRFFKILSQIFLKNNLQTKILHVK